MLFFFAGTWSYPTVSGTKPPFCSGFSLTMIDDIQAVLYGGDQVDRGFTSEVRIFDLSRMVSGMLVHNNYNRRVQPIFTPIQASLDRINMPPVMGVEPGGSSPCDGDGARVFFYGGGARGFNGFCDGGGARGFPCTQKLHSHTHEKRIPFCYVLHP